LDDIAVTVITGFLELDDGFADGGLHRAFGLGHECDLRNEGMRIDGLIPSAIQ
jgi:hypothetical protein